MPPGHQDPDPLDDMSYDDLWRLSESIGDVKKKGLSKQALKVLPAVVFKKDEGEKTCTICLMDFEEGEKLSVVPCFHRFHDVCIKTWLKTNGVCPICRQKV